MFSPSGLDILIPENDWKNYRFILKFCSRMGRRMNSWSKCEGMLLNNGNTAFCLHPVD
jgi:hypothetical protein